MVALKIIRNKKRFHHQALVEVKVLKNLKDKDPNGSSNIIHLKDYFYFRNHLCITFGLMSVNLYEFIKNNNFQGVSLGLIRRFAIQILAALRFMRKLKIMSLWELNSYFDAERQCARLRLYSSCAKETRP